MTPRGWRRALRVPRPADRQAREDVEAEIAFHLDMRTDELMAAGLDPEEARRRAEREFGDARRARDDLVPRARWHERRARAATILAESWGDVRYGLRGLRADPRFAAVAILTLGLAIGATASVFSVLDAVLLRPLPVESPDRLVMLWTGSPDGGTRGRPDYLTADAWRRHSESFEDMAFLDPVTATMTGADGAERVRVARISANFLPLLGVEPVLGRAFTAGEAERRERLALVSHAFWRTRLGAAPDATGGTIELDGRTSRIIGVLPADFHIPGLDGEVWEPYTMFPDWEATGNEGAWFVIGRLRPHATLGSARAEMRAVEAALDARRPENAREDGVTMIPLARHVVGPRPRLALWMLTGAALCVLLIATANVAGLSLARSVGRAGEFAVRVSLGAGPGRIARQLVVESVTLALLSGVFGAGLAVAGIDLIRAFGPGDLARLDQAGLDPAVLGWTLAVSVIAGTLIGLGPSWTTARRSLRAPRAEGGRGTSDGPGIRRVRRGLVVAELALAIVLLAGAGLLVRSWQSLTGVDPGFATERLLSVNLSTTGFQGDAQRVAFYADALARVASLPGVEGAGMIGDLFTDGDVEVMLTAEGEESSARVRLRLDEVSPDLFRTLETPLIGGRFFTAADGPEAPDVAIVNEAMAERLWGGRDPVGRRFKQGSRDSGAPWFTVVGVVGDMRRQGLEREPIPQLFVPLAQRPSGSAILLVRSSVEDPLDVAGAVRAALRDVDARVPLYSVSSVADQIGTDLRQRRFQTSLLIGFSLVALLMAAIGVYGLIHYAVSSRTREFAIRMAVGARAADILGITMREGLGLTMAGLALGLLGAIWVGRASAGLLYDVSASDPMTLATVSALLAAVAAAACYLPARRAMRVDPLTALRHE